MHGTRRVPGVDDVADEDEYDEFAEVRAKGSHTRVTEKHKIIRKPKFIRVIVMIPVPPCTWKLSHKTSLCAYPAT